MTRTTPPRHLRAFVVTALTLALAACSGPYPNSTFHHTTDFNRVIDQQWDLLMGAGTAVFIVVEAILIYTIFRYRRREGAPDPKQVHGNTTMEIAWTIAPALILAFLAKPTVEAIWKTQAKAPANALQVEVIGHQWWWEFRYPQYGIVTANELFLPTGRAANFALKTRDVLHAFWIPVLGGKRDLVNNRVNHIWFTPDSTTPGVFNGSCNEYCGDSHANMRFRAVVVSPSDFDAWVNHQKSNALFTVPPAPAPVAPVSGAKPAPVAPPAAQQPVIQQASYTYPHDNLPVHVVPATPLPAGLTFTDNLTGDPANGRAMLLGMKAPCLTCHNIRGERQFLSDDMAQGPNLTHVGSRLTIAGGLYPNDAAHLARWIKNSGAMKPGSKMPTLGAGEINPMTKTAVPAAAGLSDQQIADIVAYLRLLK